MSAIPSAIRIPNIAKLRGFAEQIDELLKPATRIVAFTVNMWTRYFSVQAARYIKQKSPHTVILFGGVDCFVGEYNQFFLDEGSCDIICQGEAEIAFAKFLAGLKTHGWRTSVPGFVYQDENGNRVNTGRVELPTLKDPQPPHIFDAFDFSLYAELGRAPFFFSRGCPFTCRFCSETTNFSKFRCRVPVEAFNEAVSIAATLRRYVARRRLISPIRYLMPTSPTCWSSPRSSSRAAFPSIWARKDTSTIR